MILLKDYLNKNAKVPLRLKGDCERKLIICQQKFAASEETFLLIKLVFKVS